MVNPVLMTALSLAAPSMGDAPVRLISQHGVELRADEQIFLLFAALNAAGYSEESLEKGPPLRAPVFHPIRVEVRDALHKYQDKPSMEAVRKLFETHPEEIEIYVEAALLSDAKSGSPGAKRLAPALASALAKFREEAELVKLFDAVAAEQRNHAKKLKEALEKDFIKAAGVLGVAALLAPPDLVVVPNPLDAHDSVRHAAVGKMRIVVVGPGLESARRVVLEESVGAHLAAAVDESYKRARAYAQAWDALKSSKAVRRFGSGERYLGASLARAVAFRTLGSADGAAGAEAEEAFHEAEAKSGIRWSRAALRLVDARGAEPLADALPKVLGKVSP